MADPIPINASIQPKFDVERELLDYFMNKVRTYMTETGTAPQAVALVLLGDNSDGDTAVSGSSWSPDGSRSRFETCAMAATILTQRATM